MITVSTMVDVEVDLGEIDDDDLIEELNSRALSPQHLGAVVGGDELNAQRQAMLRALWDNDEAKAVELLKTYLCDCLGRAAI